jgi:rfaE bifunctional protein kinase chain/domain
MVRSFEKMKDFVEHGIKNCTILIIGDIMLDKYYFGEVRRISPEAPVPITRVIKEKETLGGAGNVAHNVALLGCNTMIAGVVGKDEHCTGLIQLLDSKAILHEGLVAKNGPTTTKLRVIGGHQQMIRLDFEETQPIEQATEEKLKNYIAAVLPGQVGCVIISDYNKGVCTPALCQFIIESCAMHQIPVIVDPKGSNWQKYKGASYITPNLLELNEAVHSSVANDDEQVKLAAQRIRRKYQIQNVMVTRSEKGLSLIGGKRCVHIPTLAQEVFDVSGAGDTVIAAVGAALAGKLDPNDAAYLANMAAGIVVGKAGTYAISREELLATLCHCEEV